MSHSPRPAPRLAFALTAVIAGVAAVVLIGGAAFVLTTGVSEPWLAAAAIVLIGSLTWLWVQRRR